MVYATSYSQIFKFSDRKWRQMLRVVASGKEVNYNDYGKPVAFVDHNITDLDAETAAAILGEQ